VHGFVIDNGHGRLPASLYIVQMESACDGEHIHAAPVLPTQCDGEERCRLSAPSLTGQAFPARPGGSIEPDDRRCLTMVFSCTYTEWHKHWMALCQ